jgi:hypothetical protein
MSAGEAAEQVFIGYLIVIVAGAIALGVLIGVIAL